MSGITLKNLNKTYPNGFLSVKNVSLSIEDGEFVTFHGPSGCGKSTILRMIGGLEEITSGAISGGSMGVSLSLGVAVSVGLAMIRVLTGISVFWFILPGYVIAICLSFFVPKIFTAIAFDSGGVASGPMTATFLLPFAMGACQAVGGNIVRDAFGIVAMVSMTPLIAIQIQGAVYKYRTAKQDTAETQTISVSYLDILADDDIIEL